MGRHGEDQEPEAISDEELIQLVASGDEEAFDQVYLRYKAKLRKFIVGFIEDEPTAEDMLQETFLRVHRNAGRYEPTHKFGGWLYRIAANLCLNELRRRRTHPHISLNQQVQFAVTESESETVELHELVPDSSFVAPSRAAEESETMREIAAALDTLSAAHRDVLTMHLYDDLKYEQIAEILRCSVGTVKSRAFYGIRNLRDKLEPDDSVLP
jgi:RNA polymerase sigma-70 factor (ECF subfamily)